MGKVAGPSGIVAETLKISSGICMIPPYIPKLHMKVSYLMTGIAVQFLIVIRTKEILQKETNTGISN